MGNTPINEVLREKRIKEGISTDKIFYETHIPSKFINMIENGEWENFPSRLHMKGFIRIYADYLKIPRQVVEEGIKTLTIEITADCAPQDEKNPKEKHRQPLKVEKSIYLLMFLAAIFVILYLLILYLLPE